jgi:hypothetical protein
MYVSVGNKSLALNTALEGLNDCLVVFTDDDVRLHPDTLCAYAEAAKSDPCDRFYGGPTGVDYELPPPKWILEYLPVSAKGRRAEAGTTLTTEPAFLGCNWAAFARDLRRVGGFNASKGPGARSGSTGQETDMQVRLLNAGLVGRYVPAAMVWHFVPASCCSQEWALRRAYRHGIERGLNACLPKGPTLLDYPPRVCAEWVKRALKALVWSVGGSQARFRRNFYLRSFAGYMKGISLQRRHLLPTSTVSEVGRDS